MDGNWKLSSRLRSLAEARGAHLNPIEPAIVPTLQVGAWAGGRDPTLEAAGTVPRIAAGYGEFNAGAGQEGLCALSAGVAGDRGMFALVRAIRIYNRSASDCEFKVGIAPVLGVGAVATEGFIDPRLRGEPTFFQVGTSNTAAPPSWRVQYQGILPARASFALWEVLDLPYVISDRIYSGAVEMVAVGGVTQQRNLVVAWLWEEFQHPDGPNWR